MGVDTVVGVEVGVEGCFRIDAVVGVVSPPEVVRVPRDADGEKEGALGRGTTPPTGSTVTALLVKKLSALLASALLVLSLLVLKSSFSAPSDNSVAPSI